MAKYGNPITNETLLDRLNSNMSDTPKYGEAVNDADILKKLESNNNDFSSYLPINNEVQNFIKRLPANAATGIMQAGHEIANIPSDVAKFAEKNLSQENTLAHQMKINSSDIPRIPNFNYGQVMGLEPNTSNEITQSVFKNLVGMGLPEAKLGKAGKLIEKIPLAGKYLSESAANIIPQAGWGAATNENRGEGAKEFGGMQAVLEGIRAPFKIMGGLAEGYNPIKYAGKIAEEIRNNARNGYEKAKTYYDPVHAKYDEHLVTTTPEKYLGFHPEDKQYFKPEVNRAYRDFIAEPIFKNLHDLQSVMGKYPELQPMREIVKQKGGSFLSQDPKMLESYKTGSNIMRDEYYPYTANDVLHDITEHKKPIEKFKPNQLLQAIIKSPLIEKAEKSLEPINHPLVKLKEQLQNKVNFGEAASTLTPAAIGAGLGYLISPEMSGMTNLVSSILGFGGGAAASKYFAPGYAAIAQNPWIVKFLENAHRGKIQPVARQATGYYNNQQQQ